MLAVISVCSRGHWTEQLNLVWLFLHNDVGLQAFWVRDSGKSHGSLYNLKSKSGSIPSAVIHWPMHAKRCSVSSAEEIDPHDRFYKNTWTRNVSVPSFGKYYLPHFYVTFLQYKNKFSHLTKSPPSHFTLWHQAQTPNLGSLHKMKSSCKSSFFDVFSPARYWFSELWIICLSHHSTYNRGVGYKWGEWYRRPIAKFEIKFSINFYFLNWKSILLYENESP